MVIFPNCKINLGLRITGKRQDGYHSLETIFYPVQLKDALEIIEDDSANDGFELIVSGIGIPGNSSMNLCHKAWELIKRNFPSLPSLRMFLHKAIPAGAGLGGGSSDGAFALQLLNSKFGLGIGKEQLLNYALQLGSDCPFFIVNRPCVATGRGEIIKEVNADLSGYYIVLVNAGIHIDTTWAFSQIKPAPSEISLTEIISQPIGSWKNYLINDFEEPVFNKYPEIREVKQKLYGEGAVFASMTGTGSTVFGIFSRKPSNITGKIPHSILLSL